MSCPSAAPRPTKISYARRAISIRGGRLFLAVLCLEVTAFFRTREAIGLSLTGDVKAVKVAG
jgi:hypothetical protein